MFGRNARRQARPSEDARMVGYHTETIVVGDADVPAIQRDRALRHTIGLGLQGYSATAVGYDRGDPARSYTAPIPAALASPTQAMATVGRIADAQKMAPVPEYADVPGSDPALDPYMAALWNRISR